VAPPSYEVGLSREEATRSDCRRSSDGGGGAARASSESRVACGAARAPRVAGGRRSGPEGAKVEEVRLRRRWHSRHEEEEDVGLQMKIGHGLTLSLSNTWCRSLYNLHVGKSS
jgi:hypothetical protein